MPLGLVIPLLPPALREELSRTLPTLSVKKSALAEIRLRCDRVASLSLFREGRLINLPLTFRACEQDLKDTLSRAVGGSVYSFEEELKEGFVTLAQGVRVGVAGCVSRGAGGALALCAIHSLVFRLPCGRADARALLSFYRESEGGILLFAPPGGGKTSLLRALAEGVATDIRVCVVDARREFFFHDASLLLDHLLGYPKAMGAEMAVRTLSPELLILDELGSAEASALASLASLGVRVVASVHGASGKEVLSSPTLSPLFSSGLFSHLWDTRRACPLPVQEEALV